MLVFLSLWVRASTSVHAGVDLADAPLVTRIQSPPANIMVLLDDSTSMSCEVLVHGHYDGFFPDPTNTNPQQGFCYIFDNLGDGVSTDNWRYMGPDGRKYWQAQWHQVNVMYYNPTMTYEPWSVTARNPFAPADPENPRPHPLIDTGKRLDLDGGSFSVGSLVVKCAHYFIPSGGIIYLVVIDGEDQAIKYYTATVTGSGLAEKVDTVVEEFAPPAEIVTGRTYAQERQNFANWYTYYRRREYTAKAALASVTRTMAGVRIGILGLNEKIRVPPKPVRATIGGLLQDQSDTLLDALYAFQSSGNTPLKRGLDVVGGYYRNNDGNLAGVSGDVPYPEDGGACQQAFVVVMTDGFYSDTDYIISPADGADNDNGPPYADNYTDTLADIAMYYYENDLSAYDDLVPTNKYDKAEHQHVVTYAVAFGVNGTLNPEDYILDPANPDYLKHNVLGNYVRWPPLTQVRQPESIDDLWHATVNGRGAFLNAANPRELSDALAALMQGITQRHKGSAAATTVNGPLLHAIVSNELLIFQTSFSKYNDEWIGDVKAFHVDTITGTVHGDDPVWSAAETLDARDPDSRTILSYNGRNAGILFQADQLTVDQQKMLGSDFNAVVEYLRGKEISGYRVRSQKLGDIVHSSAVFQNNVVYVGANDGMMHAFDTLNGGEEIFAYVPNLVFANLKELATAEYTHMYFVDLTPTVKQGKGIFGGTATQTILVGGLAKGGKGYFALDITDSRSMTASAVKWEFPKDDTLSEDANDVGYSFSRPVIVQSYSAANKWIVIFGNGYDNATDKSVLFILNPTDGTILKKIEAGRGPDNGLSTPIAIDVDLDDKVDFVYAGDLKGNLWKFDLTSPATEKWGIAHKDDSGTPQPLFIAKGPEADPLAAIQSITVKPDVMLHPTKPGYLVCFGTGKFLGESDFSDRTIQTLYGIWDYGDKIYQLGHGWSLDDDREYLGLFTTRDDRPQTQQLSHQPPGVGLLRQAASSYTVDAGGREVVTRVLSKEKPEWVTETDSNGQLPDPSSTKRNHVGWYFDLTEGERVISDVIIRDGRLISIGFIPNELRCAEGGNSFFMEIDACSGGGFDSAAFDINADARIGGGTLENPGDYVNVGTLENPSWIAPNGILLRGNVQTPVVLSYDPSAAPACDEPPCPWPLTPPRCTEVKISSSSTGEMVEITEACAAAGVLYWKEVLQD